MSFPPPRASKSALFCYYFHRHLCNVQVIPNQSEHFVVERSWINEANSEINVLRGGSRLKTSL